MSPARDNQMCIRDSMNEAYATAVVLLVVVLLMNALSAFVAKKLTKK